MYAIMDMCQAERKKVGNNDGVRDSETIAVKARMIRTLVTT